jgi:hypothetical protein
VSGKKLEPEGWGMKKLMVLQFLVCFSIGIITSLCDAESTGDFREVERILGSSGQMQEGSMVFPFPRSDIKVAIHGESIPTAFGFGSWTAWKNMGSETMVMGDLVLLENEINPVISALAEENVNVTALHNHFLGEKPRMMYMHIFGVGQAGMLARGIRKALDKTATPRSLPAPTSASPAIDTKRIEQIIGHPGHAGGGIFKIIVGRPGVRAHGMELTSSMGLNSWIAFIGTNERAHVAGDMAMVANEVNPVIRAFRKHGIRILAVHNHMLDEEPRIFFLHYWGTGKVENLARAFRDALAQLKKQEVK